MGRPGSGVLFATVLDLAINTFEEIRNAHAPSVGRVVHFGRFWVNWVLAQKPNLNINFMNKKYDITNISRDN